MSSQTLTIGTFIRYMVSVVEDDVLKKCFKVPGICDAVDMWMNFYTTHFIDETTEIQNN